MEKANASQIVLFESTDGEVSLDVTIDTQNDEVWLNRNQLALLFDRDIKTIGKHINNAFKEELDSLPQAVGKTYQVEHCNLDGIISVGYRVQSQRDVEFRRWATETL